MEGSESYMLRETQIGKVADFEIILSLTSSFLHVQVPDILKQAEQ
jgi:hypothetical protein